VAGIPDLFDMVVQLPSSAACTIPDESSYRRLQLDPDFPAARNGDGSRTRQPVIGVEADGPWPRAQRPRRPASDRARRLAPPRSCMRRWWCSARSTKTAACASISRCCSTILVRASSSAATSASSVPGPPQACGDGQHGLLCRPLGTAKAAAPGPVPVHAERRANGR
jgi:hypothetical protein